MTGEASRRRGRSRELDVLHHFQDEGWVSYRLAWGNADVMACRLELVDDDEPATTYRMRLLLVQVKATGSGPWDHFRPLDREHLLAEAESCGAEAVLAFWPPYGHLQLINAHAWPKRARMEAVA